MERREREGLTRAVDVGLATLVLDEHGDLGAAEHGELVGLLHEPALALVERDLALPLLYDVFNFNFVSPTNTGEGSNRCVITVRAAGEGGRHGCESAGGGGTEEWHGAAAVGVAAAVRGGACVHIENRNAMPATQYEGREMRGREVARGSAPGQHPLGYPVGAAGKGMGVGIRAHRASWGMSERAEGREGGWGMRELGG